MKILLGRTKPSTIGRMQHEGAIWTYSWSIKMTY